MAVVTDWGLPPASRDDFEVAIICALSREAAAVLAVCDRLFLNDDDLEYGKTDGDDNKYTTGRIGKHAVVVVWLDNMGKETAAKAAASLRISYPRIRLALLVGICGGTPKHNQGEDILLGDVVVSSEIYQYDFRKRYPNGDDVRDTTKHRKYDPAVSAIVERLAADNRDKVSQELSRLVDKLTQRHEMYGHPGAGTDVLFPPNYQHKHHGGCARCAKLQGCKKAREVSCAELGCDSRFQVTRARIEAINKASGTEIYSSLLHPRWHFGVMGCGDTVIKSGKYRDAKTKGKGVIGVEMESAGMFVSFPGIVVKSVCDYADSHKNKEWQDYAAGTAACAAKVLLNTVTPRDRQTMKLFSDGAKNLGPFTTQQGAHSRTNPMQFKHKIWTNFVDRPDLMLQMEQAVFRENTDGQKRPLVVCGMAGSGKTQLCLRFSDLQLRQKTFETHFVVDASSRAAAESDFGAIAQWAGLSPTFEAGKTYLSNRTDSWILILDHAEDGTFPLRDLFPNPRRGCIVITTRRRNLDYDQVHVGPMSIDEGITFLLKSSAKAVDDPKYREQAEPIVKELGCLPLALKHIAVPIRHRLCTLDSVLDYYKRNKQTLFSNAGNKRCEEGTYEYSSLEASINVSLQALIAPPKPEGLDRALEILQLCAFFHFEAIPERVLLAAPSWREQGLLAITQGYISRLFSLSRFRGRDNIPVPPLSDSISTGSRGKMAQALRRITSLPDTPRAGEEDNQLQQDEDIKALSLLHLTGLGNFDVDTGLFSIHPVVHEWNRHRLMKQDSNWARWSAGVALFRSIPWRDVIESCPRRSLLSHIDFYLRTAHETSPGPETLTVAQANVVEKFALVYQDNGKYDDAANFFQQSLDAKKRVLDTRDSDILRTLGRYSVVLEKKRDHVRAHEYSKAAWEGLESFSNAPSREALESLGTYASSLHGLGNFHEAEEINRQCLQHHKAQVDRSLIDEAAKMECTTNLGLALMRQGKYHEAIEFLLEAYSWRLENLGGRNVDTVRSLRDLALAYRDAEDFEAAAEKGRRALQLREELLGKSHPDTLISMTELSFVLRRLGNRKEAERLSTEASTSLKQSMGSTNPDTLESLSSVAALLKNRGDYAAAKDLYRHMLKGYGEQFVPNHSDVLRTMCGLAGTLRAPEEGEESETLFREALAGFQGQHDPGHPDIIKCQIGLIACLERRDKADEAAAVHLEIDSQLKVPPAQSHSLKALWVFNYAVFLRRRGDYAKARTKMLEAMEAYSANFGPQSQEVIDSIAGLAFILDCDGRHAEAWDHYLRAVRSYGKMGLTSSIHYATCVGRFAAMRKKMEVLGIADPRREETETGRARKKRDADQSDDVKRRRIIRD